MNNKELIDMVETYGKAIYGFCYNLTKNKTDADDLYQDTFLKAMELLHKIDFQNNPKSFLMSIAVGLWKNKRRKYAWRQRIAPTEEFDPKKQELIPKSPNWFLTPIYWLIEESPKPCRYWVGDTI